MVDESRDFDPLAVDIPRLLAALGIPAEHEGDRWIARCPHPDHNDKNPSWDIKDTPGQSKHGLHSCLSCKWEGTSTDLAMDLLHITFQGARRWIEENAMGQQPIVQSIALQTALRGGRGFRLPPETIQAPLEEWPETAQRYAIDDRKITPEQVEKWGLGYATTGRCAGRIIIPCRDARGVLTHYTARTFVDSPKRYLEPKKTEGAVDGAIFGEEFWPAEEKRDLLVVTEGALNALAVERVANLSIGSLFGTNTSLMAVMKISTFKRVMLLTDPDLAGDRAAEKIERAVQRQVELVRVELPREPKGIDANKMHPSDLRSALKKAWLQFSK